MGTARSWSENHGENKLKSWGDLRPQAHPMKIIESKPDALDTAIRNDFLRCLAAAPAFIASMKRDRRAVEDQPPRLILRSAGALR